MSYRPGLPTVLNRISVNVKGGEKVGVVGRCISRSWTLCNWKLTCSAKDWGWEIISHASPVQDCRIVLRVNYCRRVSGSPRGNYICTNVVIYFSVDISTIGLKDLRSKISIIPQDVSLTPLLLCTYNWLELFIAIAVQRNYPIQSRSVLVVRRRPFMGCAPQILSYGHLWRIQGGTRWFVATPCTSVYSWHCNRGRGSQLECRRAITPQSSPRARQG